MSARVAAVLMLACLVAVPMPARAAGTPSVTIAHYAYSPHTLTIRSGDTVTWTNADSAPHDVTTTHGPVSIHSSTMHTGQSWSYTFTVPGTYTYICSIHPDMHATLIVTPLASTTHAPAQTPSARPTHASASASVVPVHSSPASRSPAPPAQPASAAITPAATPTLRPLLLVAGLVAAIAVLCLLLVASRPEDGTG